MKGFEYRACYNLLKEHEDARSNYGLLVEYFITDYLNGDYTKLHKFCINSFLRYSRVIQNDKKLFSPDKKTQAFRKNREKGLHGSRINDK